ncbi:MAG: adenosylcobinamide-GDP ribazoletransferase [Gammaproteobacteria bacterium]|nr:adenosylcobinamide-GDP ribazoletransferase [Gammaproteobacteria bacterium]
MIRPILLAVQFLTRLPTPNLAAISDREIGLSQYYYPLVGLMIGVILSLSALYITLPSSHLLAAIVLTTWVMLTGALHLDGLADCADAWVGGYGDKDKTLAIMKDPQSGPVAVTLVVCLLLLKFSAIEAVITQQAWAALILSPVLARSLLPLLFHTTRYVRSSGLGQALTQHKSNTRHLLMQLLTVTLAVSLMGISALIVIFAALSVFFIIRQLSIKRISGITGDVAGTLVELSEVIVLIAFLSL